MTDYEAARSEEEHRRDEEEHYRGRKPVAICPKCGLEHYSHMSAANCCRLEGKP